MFGFVSGSRIRIPDLRSGSCATQEPEVPVVLPLSHQAVSSSLAVPETTAPAGTLELQPSPSSERLCQNPAGALIYSPSNKAGGGF